MKLSTWVHGGRGRRSGGTEFSSQAALSSYLQAHPHADRSKHSVAQAASKAEPPPSPHAAKKQPSAVEQRLGAEEFRKQAMVAQTGRRPAESDKAIDASYKANRASETHPPAAAAVSHERAAKSHVRAAEASKAVSEAKRAAGDIRGSEESAKHAAAHSMMAEHHQSKSDSIKKAITFHGQR